MRPTLPVVPLALAWALGVVGCDSLEDEGPGATGGAPAGDSRFSVPEGLPNTELEGQEGGLTLVAFTLTRGAVGLELYAAVRNDGATPACEVGMMIDFYGQGDQLVTSVGSVVQSGYFYRIDDGSGVVLSCIPPGKIGMSATTGLPSEIVLEELVSLKHNFPAFTVSGIVPVEGIQVSAVRGAARAEGRVYTGTFTNRLEVAAGTPKVTIFPVNRVGRPLGAATANATMDVPPGTSWAFETTAVADPGTGQEVYPAATVSFAPSGD